MCTILYHLKLVKGNISPKEMVNSPKTRESIDRLLRLCKSITAVEKVIILGSVYCVVQGPVELKKVEVYVCVLIKKLLLTKTYPR